MIPVRIYCVHFAVRPTCKVLRAAFDHAFIFGTCRKDGVMRFGDMQFKQALCRHGSAALRARESVAAGVVTLELAHAVKFPRARTNQRTATAALKRVRIAVRVEDCHLIAHGFSERKAHLAAKKGLNLVHIRVGLIRGVAATK